MKPAAFEYHAPETVADAVGLLAEHADDVKPLAGGQSLVPMLALRLTRFAHCRPQPDRRAERVSRSERHAHHRRDDTPARRSSATRQVAAAVPLLGLATPHIGHFQIRNRGTVGGSLAHADPASELPAVALTLDAELRARDRRRHPPGRGGRLLRGDLDDLQPPTTSSSSPPTSRSGRAASASRSTRWPAATATSRSRASPRRSSSRATASSSGPRSGSSAWVRPPSGREPRRPRCSARRHRRRRS